MHIRQGIARIAGVQQQWWCWHCLNTQWGWQWRVCVYTISLGLLTTQLQTPMDVVGAPRERNDCRGSSLQYLWERNGNNITQCKRGTSTVDTPWGRGRDAVAHPWTPCKRSRRLQRSRRDLVRLRCALTALLRRCRRSHCAATATLRCSRCTHVRTPSHGAYFEHAQCARRGMVT